MAKIVTTTFVIDQNCNPRNWTINDLMTLDEFVREGGSVRAAHLRTIGIAVVASEHHEPLGGTIEFLGYSAPVKGAARGNEIMPYEYVQDLCDEMDRDPIGPTAVVKIYQGPVQYAVGIPIGDEDGNIEGYEFEFKDTEAEAKAYLED